MGADGMSRNGDAEDPRRGQHPFRLRSALSSGPFGPADDAVVVVTTPLPPQYGSSTLRCFAPVVLTGTL
jgi:hypothetical protein